MTMPTVYRLEHYITKMGPYNHVPELDHFDCEDDLEEYEDEFLDLRENMGAEHSDDEHPVLRENGFISACVSKHALELWFDGYMDILTRFGFYVREIDTDAVHDGDLSGQVLIPMGA